jgi:hypothetical protein
LSEGQVQWPDSDEFSIEFLRLLGAAQEGGSMVSECFLAAAGSTRTIAPIPGIGNGSGSPISAMSAATAAFERGHVLTAQSNWLRAINYYQASTFALDAPTGSGRTRSEPCEPAPAATSRI